MMLTTLPTLFNLTSLMTSLMLLALLMLSPLSKWLVLSSWIDNVEDVDAGTFVDIVDPGHVAG